MLSVSPKPVLQLSSHLLLPVRCFHQSQLIQIFSHLFLHWSPCLMLSPKPVYINFVSPAPPCPMLSSKPVYTNFVSPAPPCPMLPPKPAFTNLAFTKASSYKSCFHQSQLIQIFSPCPMLGPKPVYTNRISPVPPCPMLPPKPANTNLISPVLEPQPPVQVWLPPS